MVCPGAQTLEQVGLADTSKLSHTGLSQQGLFSKAGHQELESLDTSLCPALYPPSLLPQSRLGSPVAVSLCASVRPSGRTSSTQPLLRGLGREGSLERQRVNSSALPRVVPMASCLAGVRTELRPALCFSLTGSPSLCDYCPNSTVSGHMAQTLLSNCPEVTQWMGVAWNTNLGMDLNSQHTITGSLCPRGPTHSYTLNSEAYRNQPCLCQLQLCITG